MAKESKKADRKSKKDKSTRKVEKATKAAAESLPSPEVATPHAEKKDMDFEINWANFDKVKEHFGLNDAECQEVLVATCGPDKQAEKYWDQFKKSPAPTAETKPAECKPPAPTAETKCKPTTAETKPNTTADTKGKTFQPPAGATSEPPTKKRRVSEAVETLDSQPLDWEEWMSPDTEEDGDSMSETAQSKTNDDSPDAPSPAAAVVEETPEAVCTAQKPDGEPPREEIEIEDDLVKELETQFELQDKKAILPVPTHPAKKKVRCFNPKVQRFKTYLIDEQCLEGKNVSLRLHLGLPNAGNFHASTTSANVWAS